MTNSTSIPCFASFKLNMQTIISSNKFKFCLTISVRVIIVVFSFPKLNKFSERFLKVLRKVFVENAAFFSFKPAVFD